MLEHSFILRFVMIDGGSIILKKKTQSPALEAKQKCNVSNGSLMPIDFSLAVKRKKG